MKSLLSTCMTLLVILLLFLAFNLVWALKLPNLTWDFSEHKTNSLFQSSQRLLDDLEGPMDLYFFNSAMYSKHYANKVERLLKTYQNQANGKINLHLINPAPFSEEEYKARLFGLEGTPGFLGLIGTRAGHGAQRIGSFSQDREALLEYEISHLIYKVAQPQQPVIGVLSALPMEGETDKKGQTASPPWQLLQELRRHFNLVTLSPHLERIPEHVKTLMLVQPAKLPERTLYAIDQFVLGGGKLMMFLDPHTETSAETSGVHGLLAAWGVQMPASKTLADSAYASSTLLTQGQPAVRHPAALTLPRQAMTPNDISTLKVHTVTVLNSGALLPLKRSRTAFTPLLQSSTQAALFDTSRVTDPGQFEALLAETALRGQRHVIAARIEGPAYSAFPEGINGANTGLQKAANIHIVVVADTDLLTDRVWAAAQNNNGAPKSGNATFILNTLDNLAAPEALANIRPRPSNSSYGLLQTLRNDAEHTYQQNTAELKRRQESTEREWQRLNPPTVAMGTEPVSANPLLQVLNKERLRLPIEINVIRLQAYAQVHALEQKVKLLTLVPVPLLLCLIALGIGLARRRRRALYRALA